MASVAAIGLRLHTGWAASVLVAQGSAKASTLVARRRILLCEPPRAKRPDHAAENMELQKAEAFITACRITTVALAACDVALHHIKGAGMKPILCPTLASLCPSLESFGKLALLL